MEWQPIETAPKDGTPIQAKIPGHGADNVIAFHHDFLDSDEKDCGAWVFVENQEPPDDWSDGVCWEVNDDGARSTHPTHWMPLPALPLPDDRREVIMSGDTQQYLIHYHAICTECDKSCSARNAQAWAHNHARSTGHAVGLELGWTIRKDAP